MPCIRASSSRDGAYRRRRDLPDDRPPALQLRRPPVRAQRAAAPAKVAYVDDRGSLTYGELERPRRAASPPRCSRSGMRREERVLLLMLDCNDWPVAFLGCLYAGVVPVAVNTLLTADDYAYMLAHSRAQAALVSAPLLPVLTTAHGRGGARGRATRDRRRRRRAPTPPPARVDFDALLARAARRSPRRPPTAPRRPGVLALLVGLDRQAQGHGAHARQPWWTAELYGKAGARPDRERRLLLGRQALLRLRPRQRAHLPALGRRHARADGRAADARRGLQALDRTRAAAADMRPTVFFGAPTGFAGMLASPDAAAARRGRAAHVLVGRRGAAGARSASASSATSAARSSTASARPRCCTSSCRTGPATCATAPPASRSPATSSSCAATTAGRSPTARSATSTSSGPSAALMYWGNREKSRDDLPGRLDEQRRQVLARRRRLLHLRRPQRRHAEGQRHLRLAVRGRGDADAAPGGARGAR